MLKLTQNLLRFVVSIVYQYYNKDGAWCIGCTRAFGTLGIAGSSPVAPTQI